MTAAAASSSSTMTAADGESAVREPKHEETDQTEQICRLKSKLLLYDETVAERDELRSQLDDVQRWTRELIGSERQLQGELQRDLEAQMSALGTAQRDRAALEAENRRLTDINERIAEQLTALRDNERRLTVEIDLLEIGKRRALDELGSAKADAERLAGEAMDARQELERAQIECKMVSARYDDCAAECRELTEQRGELERRLERAAAELDEAQERAIRAEDGWRANEEARACEADEAQRRLHNAALEAVVARRAAEEERANACRLEREVAELRDAADRERAEAEARAERLDRDNRANEQAACRAEARASQLRRDNERAAEEAQRLRDRARVTECLLDEMKRSSGRVANDRLQEAERVKAALKCDVQAADAKIVRLECEIRRLRDKMGSAAECGGDDCESDDGCGGGGGGGITTMCKKLYDEIESLINCGGGD